MNTSTRLVATRARIAVALLLGALMVTVSGCGILKNGAYDLPLPGGPNTGSNPDTITVHFASVDGLVPKSTVKVGDVAIGEVEKISVDQSNWTATVTCVIRHDVDLPANAIAEVRRSSLLGEWFVQIEPPSGVAPTGRLTDGATIGIAQTTQSAPVEEILGALSLLLNDGGVPQLNTIVHELDNALAGRGPQLRDLLSQLDTFTQRLDGHKQDIVAALDALNHLSTTLDANKTDIASALDALPAGVQVLAAQRQQLVRLLGSLNRLSNVAGHVVRTSAAGTVADLRALQPTLTELAAAGKNLPDALKILLTFPFTPGTEGAIKGDYVNLDSRVDLDLGTLLSTIVRAGPGPLASLVPDPSAILLPQTTSSLPSPSASSVPTPTTGSGLAGTLTGLLGLLGLGDGR